MKILLADDEPSIASVVRRIVEDGGFTFCHAQDGQEVFPIAAEERPDLIILDVMMPKMNGFQVCRQLRQKGVLSPILILSAKGDLVDKEVGFSAGADDYLVKPFSPEELLMRINAHLRHHDRIAVAQSQSIVAGDLEIDVERHRATLRGEDVTLTPKEFLILSLLARHRGEIFTREQVIKEVWGEEFIGETSSVAVFIRKLREKIEDDPSHPRFIKTIRNAGYIFAA
ncbi:MAG: response regulator transcription factor [Coriobacteriales bacterium]|jgi:two-component system response regulator VicR|nr:response regulator transcription factor [Coriobacteriales bacterium]